MAGFVDYLRMAMGWWSSTAGSTPAVVITIRSVASRLYEPGSVASRLYESGSVKSTLYESGSKASVLVE